MRPLIPLITAASAFALAGMAQAADTVGATAGVDLNTSAATTTRSTSALSSLDQSGDGKISRTEASTNKDLSKQFSTLDTNKDGTLDTLEFAQFEAAGYGTSSTGGSWSAPGTAAPGGTTGTTTDSTSTTTTTTDTKSGKTGD